MSEFGVSPATKWPFSALHELTHRPRNHVASLDGLRAIAVLLVIFGHWVFEWVTVAHHSEPAISKLPMFYWGWTGVDLFFVLSGFLIGKQLWAELYRTDTIDIGRFILRRGLRIWPLYYASMLFLWLVQSSKAPSWSDWALVSNYFDARYARSWSLSSEEQFYFLMPTLLVVFRRLIPQKWWPACIVAMLAVVPLVRSVTFHVLSARGFDGPTVSTMMYSALHLHCEPLLAGMLVAWVAQRRPTWLAAQPDGVMATRVLLVAGCMAILGVALRTVNREAFAYVALGSVYASALCIALADRSWLTAILRWGGWYLIARLSFGMYLNHLILREPTDTIIAFVSRLLGPESVLAFLLGLLLTVIGSATMAAISFVLVEQPGLALRDRWLARRQKLAEPQRALTTS